MRAATKTGWAVAAVGATLALGGCSPGVPWDDEFAQYGQRITTISPSAGNTQAANAGHPNRQPLAPLRLQPPHLHRRRRRRACGAWL